MMSESCVWWNFPCRGYTKSNPISCFKSFLQFSASGRFILDQILVVAAIAINFPARDWMSCSQALQQGMKSIPRILFVHCPVRKFTPI